MTSKLDQIKDLLATYNFSMLGLSETFLDDSKPSSFHHIDSYEMVRVDRIGRSGGGILCYLKSGLKFEVLSHFDHMLEETISVKIDFKSSCSLLVCFVYRPPNSQSSWNDQLKIYLKNCTQYCKEIMTLGDFNMNLMDSQVEKRWLQNFSKFSFSQLVTEPSHVAENFLTLIDHIYCNREPNVKHVSVIKTSISDHCLAFAVRKIEVQKQTGKTRLDFYDYSHFTPENISPVFSNIDWNPVSQFTTIFKCNIHKLVKLKSRFVKSKIMPPWLVEEVRNHIKIRDHFKDRRNGKFIKEREIWLQI